MRMWFRLYTDQVNCMKVESISGDRYRDWVNLLCIAKEYGGHGGVLPSMGELAFKLRLSVKQVEERLRFLISKDLFEETEAGIVPHQWGIYQYDSDSSTSRVREHRARKTVLSETGNETFQKRFGNGIEQSRVEQSQSHSQSEGSQQNTNAGD
jgi:hypothetical protein